MKKILSVAFMSIFCRFMLPVAPRKMANSIRPLVWLKLIAEMIEPFSGTVYDPCCGSGGMFVQSHKFIERHQGNRTNISVIGQESVPDTWRLCKMNLAIRGISHDLGEKNASTFTGRSTQRSKI